mmetsp:Transcript_39925/g.96332  ORF Transcript_39925/g.96332 Transcript_39925/m.96332 type:complete len:215 (+) Transcript_39925:58-702(+)
MEESSDLCFALSLPDGSRVNIVSKEGAQEFLQQVQNFNLFSSKAKELEETRNAGVQPIKSENMFIIEVTRFLAKNSCNDLFRQKISRGEVQVWLDDAIEKVKGITNKKSWIRSGEIDRADDNVLASIHYMLRHATPLTLAFESTLFHVLADFERLAMEKAAAAPCPQTSYAKVWFPLYTMFSYKPKMYSTNHGLRRKPFKSWRRVASWNSSFDA